MSRDRDQTATMKLNFPLTVATRAVPWSVQSPSNGHFAIARSSSNGWYSELSGQSDLHRTGEDTPRSSSHFGDAWNPLDRSISIGRLGRLVEEIHDRGAMEPRSWLFHRKINATIIRRRSFENRVHDRLTIVARSWLF